MISERPASLGQANSFCNFQLEANLILFRVVHRYVEVAYVEHSLDCLKNLVEKLVHIQREAQCTPNLVQQMQLLGALGRLLNQIAILHGHADLVSQSQQKPQLRLREAASLRAVQQQQAKGLLLCLETDRNHGAHGVSHRQLPKAQENRLVLEGAPGALLLELAEDDQPAQPRNQLHEFGVQTFFPNGIAKRRIDPHGRRDCRLLRSIPAQTQKSRGHVDYTQHALERLHQSFLYLSAHEAR